MTNKTDIIQYVFNLGYTVLELYKKDKVEYYACLRFDPANPSNFIFHNTVRGKDITELMSVTGMDQIKNNIFSEKINSLLVSEFSFSQGIDYIWYISVKES